MRRWPLQLFSLELRKALSYRADFWVQFLGSLVAEITIAYFLWRSIFAFESSERIGGFSFPAMMSYYVLMPLVGRIVRGTDIGTISPEIYDGSLTRYLVFPVPFFGYKYVSYLAQSAIACVQLIVVLLLVKGASLWVPLPAGWGTLAAGVVAALAGSFLYFAVTATIEMVAFWNDSVWSLLVMLRFCVVFLGGGLLPLSLFPGWAQACLHVLPFRLMLSFPVLMLMGRIGWSEYLAGLAGCLLWGLFFLGCARALWNRGSFVYAGVGI
jgi:ABC-2 type transport system permease protein